jgi:Tol biopolymer transport system component/DNA-binding winged helix-turn-helix (wHTH) protein
VVRKYRWHDFVLDLDTYTLERNGVPVPLEPKAFNLLALFVSQPRRLFTKQEIFDAVWPATAVSDHALTRAVAQLRRALGDEAREAKYIETVPTRGYRWIPAVERMGDETPSFPHSAPERAMVDPASAATTVPPVIAAPTLAASERVPQFRRGVLPGIAAGFGVAVALLVAAAWWQRAAPTAERVPSAGDPVWPVQLTTHVALDLHPAFSPQGDAVVYVSDRSGALEIYVRSRVGGASEIALTQNGGQNVQPAWSPDGRFIAYHSARDGGIWVIPARGGTAQQIASSGSDPAWSPDGRRIAFKSDEQVDVAPSGYGAQSGGTLMVVDADGGKPRQLTRPGRPIGGHSSATWTPDGRFIAFTVFEGGANNGIWILDVETLEPSPVALGEGLYDLAFSPDGSLLLASGAQPVFYRMPFDSARGRLAGPRTAVPVPGISSVRGLSISPDGAQAAFSALVVDSQIWAQPVSPDGRPRGGAVAVTRDTSRRNSVPVVSPDGSKIAYVSTRGGEPPNIWVMAVDGQDSTQLTSDESIDVQPFWFPDGRRLGYVSNRGNTRAVWSVDLPTRRHERLFNLPPRESDADGPPATAGEVAFSPSATRAIFSLVMPPAGNRALFLTDVSPFAPRQLTGAGQWTGYPAWSPGERSIAVEIKEGPNTHAGVLDLVSGEVRRLTSLRGQTWVRSWSPDGAKIAAAAFRDGLWDLRWIDAASGAEGTITPPAGSNIYMRYPQWSPRGDVVVFERGELRGDIWTVRLDGSR